MFCGPLWHNQNSKMVTKREIVKAIAVKEFKTKGKIKTKGERQKQWPPAFCGLSSLIIWVRNNLRDEENEKSKMKSKHLRAAIKAPLHISRSLGNGYLDRKTHDEKKRKTAL
jgi:hypothetical protein